MIVRTIDVEHLRRFLARHLGLHFDETRTGALEEALQRRLESLSEEPDTYFGGIESDLAKAMREISALALMLTVGETYFFRNIDQFHALAEVCLPDRMKVPRASRTLRFLSAGCASGEEAYSLSMVAQGSVDPSWEISILGVDINATSLERAARARFSTWSLRETPPDLVRRWFRAQGRESLLEEAARTPVRFEARNLAADDARLWQRGTYDVVFCRNVLMYFTPESARAVIQRIAQSLVPGGYLFLGHAETLRGLSTEFHLCHTHGTFYYQRRERLGEPHPTLATDAFEVVPPAASITLLAESDESWVETIQRASERIDALTAPSRIASRDPLVSGSFARADVGEALRLFQAERYAEALERLSALPLVGAHDADALLLRAVLLTHSGLLPEAEEACDGLLAVDELNVGAHYALALCRECAGDHQGAGDHDRVAIYLDRSFAMPHLHLGLMARKTGDRETARRELAQAQLLLRSEDPSRILLFGGGFGRESLVALCEAELARAGANE